MSKNENKWCCSMCTYDNYEASSKCSVCLHPRGSEFIKLPPTNLEKPVVIHDVESTSFSKPYSDFIICPPSCSSKSDEKNKLQSTAATSYDSKQEKNLLKNDDEGSQISLLISNTSTVPWTCATCTFFNFKNTARCSQCHSPKTDSKETSLIESQEACFSESSNDKIIKWMCNVCTYENWNASKKCVMCLNERGAVAKPLTSSENNGNKHPSKHENVSFPSSSRSSSDSAEKRTNKNKNLNSKQKSNRDLNAQISAANNFDGSSRASDQVIYNDGYNNRRAKSRSPSSSSITSTSDDNRAQGSTNQTRNSRQRRKNDYQASSSMNDLSNSQRSSSGNLSRSNSSNHLYSPGRLDVIDNRPYKSRTRNMNWLFMKACIGVVDGNAEAVDAYLAHGGNIARCLTLDEINSLNRPSAFDVGHTLVHLAIRFQRHNILALLLTPEIAPRGFKRNPAHLSPDIAELIRLEIMASLRTIKGDFHCRFLSECCTFQLPIEICDLPSSIQQLLFSELLDQDVQKELEEESAINWSPSLLRIGDCSNRLYALWNRSAGDCLLDSVLQATWGVFDRDNVLRNAMSESLQDCATSFFKRWRDWELQQADLIGYSLTERQCLQDWAFIHSLAQQPGASLEHCHIFVLSHILRRPIIVYGIKYLKSFRGDTLGFAKFQGVYLPFLWDQSFCYTSPIALGYTRGHFTALVTMENDSKEIRSGSRHRNPFNSVKYLPLVDSDGKILPIHFTAKGEGNSEEQRKEILLEWLDCYDTEDGFLMARQRPGKRPPSLTRLIDGWLDHYRHMAFRRLGEEGDSDDNDE